MTTSYHIQPTKDRVLVKLIKQEEVKNGLIILPSARDERKAQRMGIVEAIGPKVYDIKVGMTVWFEYFSASNFGEEDKYIISESQILGYKE